MEWTIVLIIVMGVYYTIERALEHRESMARIKMGIKEDKQDE